MTETFQRGRINLVWPEDHELHGLVVVMRRRPIVLLLNELAEGEPGGELTTAEEAANVRLNAERVAELILSWNLADDAGNPVPWPPVIPDTCESYAWPPAPGPEGDEARRAGAEVLLTHCDQAMLLDMRDAYARGTSRLAPPLPQSFGPSSPAPAEGSPEPAVETWTPDMPEDWGPMPQETMRPTAASEPELVDHPV